MPNHSYADLLAFAQAMLVKAGIAQDAAQVGAEVLIRSDASGVASHGLSRLPMYLGRIRQGLVNTSPTVTTVADNGAVLVLDCDNGLGITTVPGIMDRCIERAKKHGLAACTMRNSTHYGVGNYYALKGIENDVVSVLLTNTTPCMAPTGGVDLLIGTNPITVGIPADRQKPIILDMATSNAAMGKLQAMAREGQKIPSDWAITQDGRPTDDPAEGLNGSLLPIAGYKGYGLAVIVDMLSAVLAGACFGFDIGRLDRAKVLKPEGIGHFLLVLDVAKFRDVREFKQSVDAYALLMKNSTRAEGVREIFLPGELELNKMDKAATEGVPISAALGEQLLAEAKELGLAGSAGTFEELLKRTAS